ncbi:MAG TPA: methyl-accepting chemotaxis protein [Steroidobacteraceae bacterium]|nr:methyl-accepting chemotaxis protein [Steroidobacteraceae bacterium]
MATKKRKAASRSPGPSKRTPVKAAGELAALNRSQMVLELALDGTVIGANDRFLHVMGYSLRDIKGKDHSLFVDSAEHGTDAHALFWKKLARGEHDTGQYRRLANGGTEVWLQGSFNPILDKKGKTIKVVQYATDVTSQCREAAMTRSIDLAVEREIQAIVAAFNEGNLKKRIPLTDKSGFHESLARGINQLADNMSDIVGRVKFAATEVARSADEISQGNSDLSQRTEEQASSLQETAASMEEMTSTVRQNADNAGRASQLAVAARDQAESGGVVVAKAVKAMAEINEASKKIADIIGVIDEIAFQTNLLALNAAVEAARAGELGRGFAVVASEVRSLAGRSATAAREIKGLIHDSRKKVDEGSSLVTDSGDTLEQLVSAVKQVSDIIAEIAAASQEQSSGIDQVNKVVMQLDSMTQQNSALVEEASAASESMAEQSRALAEMMDKYHVSQQLLPEGADAVADSKVGTAQPDSSERRGPSRPWAKAESKASRSRSQPQLAAANGTDHEWQQF